MKSRRVCSAEDTVVALNCQLLVVPVLRSREEPQMPPTPLKTPGRAGHCRNRSEEAVAARSGAFYWHPCRTSASPLATARPKVAYCLRPCPGRSAARSKAEWCAADPGPRLPAAEKNRGPG